MAAEHRPRPDAELIRQSIAGDAVIARIRERHQDSEAVRIAAVRSSIAANSSELAGHLKERQRLNRTIALKLKTLRGLKRQAALRKLPARLRRQINKRKESIRAREREKFLRQWKIQFDRETRNI